MPSANETPSAIERRLAKLHDEVAEANAQIYELRRDQKRHHQEALAALRDLAVAIRGKAVTPRR